MTKTLLICFFIFIMVFALTSATKNVSDTWAQVKKYIAVNAGTAKESWETADNAIITNGSMEMTPVGDGTYEATLELTPGATYNYMFFAKTGASPPSGLKANQTYWDCVPNGGLIPCGTSPVTPAAWDTTTTTPAYYKGVGEFEDSARRVLTLPDYLTTSETFYVFNNFSGKPGLVTNLIANPIDTKSVQLSWGSSYGFWGDGGEEKKAADVIAGGTYAVFRFINNDTTTYELIASVPGNVFTYTDKTVNKDWWYWYIVVSYDAYLGSPGSAYEQGVSSWDVDDADSAIPQTPIKVYLKVEGMNLDYIEKHNYEVWLTPTDVVDKFRAKRWPGRLVRVRL